MTAGRSDAPLPPSPQVALARRLNLLLDAAAEKRGAAITFREVKEKLAEHGVGMSRARWFYMKDGTGALVRDKRVLAAICEMFDVDPSFLLDMESDQLPQSIEARLEFVRALRASRVQAFAARTLADVSPDTLKAITEFLNRDIAAHAAGVSARSDSEGGLPEGP
jgi:DNA-binding Xre family transcriptional regulator